VLIRKTTTAKPAPVKTRSRKRDIDREQDNVDGSSDSGAAARLDLTELWEIMSLTDSDNIT
jgi:hypothetical protein